jgi:Fe-S cluster biosynthesis and repair protein YggX
MSDISKCNGVNNEGKICPKRENCYRFNAVSSEFWQAWVEAPFTLETEFKCDLFWGENSEKIYKQIKKILNKKK